MLSRPTAVSLSDLAIVEVPMAVLSIPLAIVNEPMAVLAGPCATVVFPMAVLVEPIALDSLPDEKAPVQRFEFEQGRRHALNEALKGADNIG